MSGKRLLAVSGLLIVMVAAGLASRGKTSNCGGNSAALGQVRTIALIARLNFMESPHQKFRFTEVNAAQREELARHSHTHWLPTARFLVSTSTILNGDTQARQIIVVCDTPYRNVPEKWIGSAPPTHAVGYADGSGGLISPAEYASLDLSKFKPLDELCPSDPR